jgi:hypothetical protein
LGAKTHLYILCLAPLCILVLGSVGSTLISRNHDCLELINNMDFTEPHKQNGGLVAFSPGGSYILTAVANRLIIRRVDSFQVALTCVVDDAPSESARALASAPTKPAVTPPGPITHATWSADAELVLAACARSGRVTVFKMRDEAWRADIAAGPEGLVRVEFAPDARSVLCFSEWGVRPGPAAAVARAANG